MIESKQAGLLRALIERDTFVEDRIDFDQQLLTDFYNSRGYVDFRVTGVNAELARERDAYFVTFQVQEGQQFRFGEITTVSEYQGVDSAPLPGHAQGHPGTVYSPSLIENSIARMERLAIRNGVDFLRVEPRVTRNDRDLTLDVEFVLQRGPRVFVERIDIEGNTTTLDRVIRRQFDIVEGDPFNPRAIRQAAERIRALRFFESVDVNAREGSRPDQVVIETDVEETTTGSVSVGASFSTDSGLGCATRVFRAQFHRARAAIVGQHLRDGGQGQLQPRLRGAGLSRSGCRARSRFLVSSRPRGTPTGCSTRRSGNSDPASPSRSARTAGSVVFYNARYEDISNHRGPRASSTSRRIRATLDQCVGYEYSYDTRRTGLDPTAGVLLVVPAGIRRAWRRQRIHQDHGRIVGQRTIFNEEVTLRAILEGGAIQFSDGQSSRSSTASTIR